VKSESFNKEPEDSFGLFSKRRKEEMEDTEVFYGRAALTQAAA
jgi:hypothetical protein